MLQFRSAYAQAATAHYKLTVKLRNIGIGGELLEWISAWLTDRKQRVAINGYCSHWTTVGSGIPRGSVLRPLLFLIFINDMGRDVGDKISFFADDSKIMRVINETGDVNGLQEDLDKLND